MNKRFYPFAAATLAIFVGISASGATYYVSPSGTGDGSSEASPCSLATGWAKLTGTADVELVLADGTYTLDAQLKAVDMASAGTYTYLVRSKSNNPANCIIDGQEKCRCIYLRDRGAGDRHAIVRGLTLTRGKNTTTSSNYDGGGAINLQGTLDNCIVSDSSVVSANKVAYGGGVYCWPNSIVTNCIVKNCTAEVTSGNNECRGGGISSGVDSGTLSIVDSQILDCTVNSKKNTSSSEENSGGGGIYNYNCNLVVRNVVISGCKVVNGGTSNPQPKFVKGGGIYCCYNNAVIENVKIENCSACGAGGAYFRASPNNNAYTDSFTDCTFTKNSSAAGGVYCSVQGYSTASFVRCLLKENSATTSAAIAIGRETSIGGCLVMSNCAVRANTSTEGKGVIKTGRGATIVETVIEDNEVNTSKGSEGGIIYCYGGNQCEYARKHLYERLVIRNNSSSGQLSSNSQHYQDGVFWVYCGGGNNNCYSNIAVRSCYVAGNTATTVASIYNPWPSETLENTRYGIWFDNCTFTGNTVTNAAPLFHTYLNSRSTRLFLNVRNCDLRGNTGPTAVVQSDLFSLNPRKVVHCAYDAGMSYISTDAAEGNLEGGPLPGNGAYLPWMDSATDGGDGTFTEKTTATYGVKVTMNNQVARHLGANPDIGARETDEGGTPTGQDDFELEILSRTEMTNALVLAEGETYTFPALNGNAYIFNQSGHRFLSFNGNVMTALDAGIGSFRAYNRDGLFLATVPVFITPTNRTVGNVYILKTEAGPDNSRTWSKASSWAKVGSAENDSYPDGQNDIAFAPFSSYRLYLNVDGSYSLGSLYIANIVDNYGALGYLWGSTSDGSASLSFYGTTGKNAAPACLMAANQSQSNIFSMHLRGDNASRKITFKVVQGTLELDSGGWTSKEKAANDGAHCMRWYSDSVYGFIDIAEGCTFRLVNAVRWGSFGDSQMWAAQHVAFGGKGLFTGSGTIELASGSPIALWDNSLCAFSGTIRSESLNYLRGWNDNRCGIVWSTAINATNATAEVNGYVDRNFSPACGVGAWTSGNTHGYGDPGSLVGHCLPYRKFTLNGGLLNLIGLNKWGSDTTFWKRDDGSYEGHYETSELCIGKGLSAVNNNWNGTRSGTAVISHFIANSLTHSDPCGTLRVSDRHFLDNKSFGTYRSENTICGLADYYVGYTGASDTANNIFPIVPWIIGNSDGNANYFWWLGVDSDNNVVRIGNRTNVDRNAMQVNQNAYVSGDFNLASDKDVNSLILSNGSKTKTLGGKTLTIRSGALGLEDKSSSLGTQSGGSSNGSVVFSERAFVYATSGDESNPNQIWSKVTAAKGFVCAYSGNLLLAGDQSGIQGELTVNNGTLQLGSLDGSTNCTLGVSTIRLIGGNAVLRINKNGSLEDKNVKFECPAGFSPKIKLQNSDTERCHKLYIDGVSIPRGTYGATGSGADNIDDEHFSGTGILHVRRDDLAGMTVQFRY